MKHEGNLYTPGREVNPVLAELCSDTSELSQEGTIQKCEGGIWRTHALFVNRRSEIAGTGVYSEMKGYPVFSSYKDGYMFEGLMKQNGMGLRTVDEDSVVVA